MAAYDVNKDAVDRVSELIAARQYVLDSDWGDSEPERRGPERLSRTTRSVQSTRHGISD